VKTKRFVSSSVNVILTRQTCIQRSSRAAEIQRRALDNYFPESIWYIFLISKCRGDWNLSQCTFWVLAKRETLRNAKFQFFLRAKHFFFGSLHCAVVLFSQMPKICTNLDLSLLYILVLGTNSKFARKIIFWRPAFAFRSPARALAAGLPRQDHVYRTIDESFRFHNIKIDEMRCKLDSTENLRSFEKHPTPP